MGLTDYTFIVKYPEFYTKDSYFSVSVGCFDTTHCFSTAIMFRPVHSLVRQSAINRHSRHRYFVASRRIRNSTYRSVSNHINRVDLGSFRRLYPASYTNLLLQVCACGRLDCSFPPNMTGIIPNIGYSVVIFKRKSSHFASELLSSVCTCRETCRTFDIVGSTI